MEVPRMNKSRKAQRRTKQSWCSSLDMCILEERFKPDPSGPSATQDTPRRFFCIVIYMKNLTITTSSCQPKPLRHRGSQHFSVATGHQRLGERDSGPLIFRNLLSAVRR